jgi:hypothetical protein
MHVLCPEHAQMLVDNGGDLLALPPVRGHDPFLFRGGNKPLSQEITTRPVGLSPKERAETIKYLEAEGHTRKQIERTLQQMENCLEFRYGEVIFKIQQAQIDRCRANLAKQSPHEVNRIRASVDRAIREAKAKLHSLSPDESDTLATDLGIWQALNELAEAGESKSRARARRNSGF